MGPTLSIDFETYYDKTVSVKGTGPVAYARKLDPLRDIYWLQMADSRGWKWGGHPLDLTEAELDRILGAERLVSHNAGFDLTMWDFFSTAAGLPGEFRGELYDKWDCTSDLSSYLGAPRTLSGAVSMLLTQEPAVSKDVRAHMKGRRYEELGRDEQGAFRDYCSRDAILPLRLEGMHGHRWNALERWVSKHTRELMRRGIGIDREITAGHLEKAEAIADEAEKSLPWAGRAKTGSRRAFFDECISRGIPTPLTTDKKSPHWQEWLEEYGDSLPWVASIGRWRAATRLVPILRGFLDQSRETGRFPVSLMYYGGHTGRFSGSGGINLQNLNRSNLEGIDLRGCLRAAPGKKLVIADFKAIEAVVSLWLCGETDILRYVRQGQNIYEAFARSTGEWTGAESLKKGNPELYQQTKIRVLGLQYGMGADKFRSVYTAQSGKEITLAESSLMVARFRHSMKKLLAGWQGVAGIVQGGARMRVAEVVIPRRSGNQLHYHTPRLVRGASNELPRLLARTPRGGQLVESSWWGGSLWENLVQGTARDLLVELILDLEDKGFPVVLHVHDEVVCEVAEDSVKDCVEMLEHWTGPEWTDGCPVGLEVMGVDGVVHYRK